MLNDYAVAWRPGPGKSFRITTVLDCRDEVDASIDFKRAACDAYPEAIVEWIRVIDARWHLPVKVIEGGEEKVYPASEFLALRAAQKTSA